MYTEWCYIFISPVYVGAISDVELTRLCGFLDVNGGQGLHNQRSSQRLGDWTEHSSIHRGTTAVATTRDWNWEKDSITTHTCWEGDRPNEAVLDPEKHNPYFISSSYKPDHICVPFWLTSSQFWFHYQKAQVMVMWSPTLSSYLTLNTMILTILTLKLNRADLFILPIYYVCSPTSKVNCTNSVSYLSIIIKML